VNKEQLLQELRAALLANEEEAKIVEIAEKIVAAGVDILEAMDVASAAIREIGDQFEAGDLYLPDLMIAGRNMERCTAVFRPHLKANATSKAGGRIVLGTVSGDIHDIGKNLVGTMLAVGGFDVIDLGVNVPPLSFLQAARDQRADMIALSALMTASLPYQKEVITLLKELGLRERVFVIVGGGPVTPEFAAQIGADGWAENAASALKLVDKILTSGQKPASAGLTTA
jgi:methylmalonyl-CoA mutase cobalamin-binding domain/chain